MAEPILKVEGIHTFIGKHHILQGVSFDVYPGKVTVLLGRNGAGKTTTLRSIMGLLSPSQGTILFQNQAIHHMKSFEIARLGIGRTFQNIELFTGLSVLDNLMAARHLHLKRGALAGAIYFGPARREEIRHLSLIHI